MLFAPETWSESIMTLGSILSEGRVRARVFRMISAYADQFDCALSLSCMPLIWRMPVDSKSDAVMDNHVSVYLGTTSFLIKTCQKR